MTISNKACKPIVDLTTGKMVKTGCRCWSCWEKYGFSQSRCDACKESICPSTNMATRCTDELVEALESGRVRRVQVQ